MVKKTVLVTGVSGLLGTIIRGGLYLEYKFTGVDGGDCPDVPTLAADSTDLDAILPAFDGADTIIGLASVANGASPWQVIYENNLRCTFNALEAARQCGVRRMIFASSDPCHRYVRK